MAGRTRLESRQREDRNCPPDQAQDTYDHPDSDRRHHVSTKKAVKYLGLLLDNKLTFWEQLRYAADKAERATGHLSRLMANIGGPSEAKRRLLMSVVHSILLYGSEVWADALKTEKYRRRLAAVQRRGALRIASSYRTVSEPAILVVAAVPPIDLLAQERKFVYTARKQHQGEAAAATAREDYTRTAREDTIRKWQQRWEEEHRGRWTARIIPNIKAWVEREHGEVDYHLTQLLTGHGCFNAYLHRMHKVESPACQYGDSDRDDALHTFFECRRWDADRRELEGKVGNLTPDNVLDTMLCNRENWKYVKAFTQRVIKGKCFESQEAPPGQ